MGPLLRDIKGENGFNKKDREHETDTAAVSLYLDYYNLKKPPFTITPDPEFLYSSLTHKAAIESILYGINSRMGFILLTGEVGTGKTTLCRAVLDRLDGNAETVYIINPSLSSIEIIQAILDDLGLEYGGGASKKELLDQLNRFLMDVTLRKPVVIIIDDAQTMTPEGLENLRLLSNLETDKRKLLQLVLVGQQELKEILSQPDLRQLKQRVTVSCQLDLIKYDELRQYISLRLFIAGDNGRIFFTKAAVREIYKASKGIPRLINIICDYTLTAAYISNSPLIKKEHAVKAVNELRYQGLVEKNIYSEIYNHIAKKRTLSALLILLICTFLFFHFNSRKIFENEPQQMTMQVKNKAIHTSNSSGSATTAISDAADSATQVKKTQNAASAKNKLNMLGDNTVNGTEIPVYYIIQISSLKSLEMTIVEGNSLRKRGFDVRWSAVHLIEKGTWYRIYLGGFLTKKEARAYKKEKELSKGIIINAPWTIEVTSGNMAETPEDICTKLTAKGIDCILEKDMVKGYMVTTGAFMSYERAQKAIPAILDMGFSVSPVIRKINRAASKEGE